MSISKVTRNYQTTIPSDIREKLHIDVGMILDFHVEKGVIIVKPKVLIDEEQAWFWTKKWQEGEKEASEDLKKGKTKTFKSVKEMRKHFEK